MLVLEASRQKASAEGRDESKRGATEELTGLFSSIPGGDSPQTTRNETRLGDTEKESCCDE